MADQEQVERLKHSVPEWNQWRQLRPKIRPNLSGADLSEADLRHADLHHANLGHADLHLANLDHANLSEADLRHANLDHANLDYADLSYANLYHACIYRVILEFANLNSANLSHTDLRAALLLSTDLYRANLYRADLSHAGIYCTNLSHANLRGTHFSGTTFDETIFAWVDLSLAKELKTAIHKGPSIVHINSVTLPHDEPTRLHFLRGVGFTETQIEYLPSLLTSRPIEYHSLFISYASQDEFIAKRLYTDLRKKDVPCWFAPHDLRPGTPILRSIEKAIYLQDKFLLILSKHAVNSRWIEREVDAALHQEIKRGQDVLFPIRLDNAVLESNAGWVTRLQHRHIGDFTGWQGDAAYQEAFTTLLRHLKAITVHHSTPSHYEQQEEDSAQ